MKTIQKVVYKTLQVINTNWNYENKFWPSSKDDKLQNIWQKKKKYVFIFINFNFL